VTERDILVNVRDALAYDGRCSAGWDARQDALANEARRLFPRLIEEIETLRANQRYEPMEPWLGKAKGSQ
jgi:hypothetical protein